MTEEKKLTPAQIAVAAEAAKKAEAGKAEAAEAAEAGKGDDAKEKKNVAPKAITMNEMMAHQRKCAAAAKKAGK